MTSEQIEAIRARYQLMKTMKEHMCLTNEEYETTKKVRIFGMPSWLLHLIKVDTGDLLDALEAKKQQMVDAVNKMERTALDNAMECDRLSDALEAEKARADKAINDNEVSRNLLNIAMSNNDGWQECAEAAEDRCSALEDALRRHACCSTCTYADTRDPTQCRGCRPFERNNWQFAHDRFSSKLENADNTKDADTKSGVEQVADKLDGGITDADK